MSQAKLLLLLLLLWPQVVQAEIPQAAIDDPRYAQGYLVCNHYSNIANNFTTDSTNTLNTCRLDAYTNQLTMYLECGTYAITNTITVYEWVDWGGTAPSGEPFANDVIRGRHDCGAGVRPTLKIANTATAFDAETTPRPMVAFRQFRPLNGNAVPGTAPSHPLLNPANYTDGASTYFHEVFEGIDLDTNGHDGAIGITMQTAQGAFLLNSTITATGSVAGIYNPPGRNSVTANITVNGGQYCVISGDYASPTLPLVNTQGISLFGITCTNPATRGFRFNDGVPPVVAGFEITKTSDGPAIQSEASGLALIDGSITLSGAASNDIAIDNRDTNAEGRNVYLRNIFVSGTTQITRHGNTITNSSGTWVQIAEQAYTDQFNKDTSPDPFVFPTYADGATRFEARSLINGTLAQSAIPTQQIVANTAPPPADIRTRHLWATMPQLEDGAVVMPVCTAYPSYDFRTVVTATNVNCTTALQTAIDDAIAAGHKRVHLPRGSILITGTINPKDAKIFGAGPQKSAIAYRNDWAPVAAIPFFQTNDSASDAPYLGFFSMYIKTQPSANDFMYYLRWRAGKSSLTVGLDYNSQFLAKCNQSTSLPVNQPRTALWFSGNGGGKHYGPHLSLPTNLDRNANSRVVFVDAATEPLSLYGMNLEMGKAGNCGIPLTNMSITGSSAGVRGFGIKREGASATATVTNSTNVALFGIGAQNGPPAPAVGSYLNVVGTTNHVLFAPSVVRDQLGTVNGMTMIAEPGLSTIPWPTTLSIYKKGLIDDAPFAAPPPPAAPIFLSATVSVADQMALCFTTYDGAAMLPAADVTGVTIAVDGGAPVTPSTSPRQGLSCYALTFPGNTITSGTQSVTVSYAPGNITSGGSVAVSTFGPVAAVNNLSGLPLQTQASCAIRSIWGQEDTANWYTDAAGVFENARMRFVQGATYRVRCKMTNTVGTLTAQIFTACYDENESDTFLPLTDSCASDGTCFADAPEVGDGTPTTRQLTTVQSTFVPGVLLEHATTQVPLTMGANTETEIEFGAQLKATVPIGNIYRYRVCKPGGTAIAAHTNTAHVTAVSLRSHQRGGGVER